MKHLKTFENKSSEIYSMIDLMIAVQKDNLLLVKDIINSGFDVNTIIEPIFHRSILNSISNSNHINYDIVKELIKAGVDVNHIDAHGDSQLIYLAYETPDMKFIKILIEADADWNIIDSDGYDFFEYLNDDYKNELIKEYPEKYQNYLMKKDTDKYNL